ncbi:MAG: PAS domain-containing protein [Alphaproteobacteria bacterium]|nr:PAS domain-containing protein [Alphaproteobacteria bacterium]
MSTGSPARRPDPDGLDRWLVLVSVVERLSAAESLREVIQVVRDTARTLSGADGVTFVLRDEGFCHYVEEDAIGPLWKGKRFPLNACISGWCMLNGKTAVIPDIYVDPRIPHDAYRPTFVKSLVMAPVRTEHPIAAIGAYWSVCREFSDGEVAVLEGLARSTAAAIAAVQARDTLRNSEERLRLALEAGQLGAWDLNLATESFTASAASKAVFGRRVDEDFSFQDLVEATHPDDRRHLERAFEEAWEGYSDLNVEFRVLRTNGTIGWIHMRGRLIRDTDSAISRLAGVSFDSTARRQAQDRMERLQSELAHVGRLSELGQMGSSFAHELVQPLAAASNYLGAARRFLKPDNALPEKAFDMVTNAEAQITRTKQTIQQIRGLARKTEPVRTIEYLGPLIEETIEIARMGTKYRTIELQLAVDKDLPPVSVDKVQIQQVLLNLLRNAFEAMEDSEIQAVTVSAMKVDDGQMIEFRVNDSGPGLAPEIAADLFKPFHTTKSHGMGVGLSICRHIIEGHGGRIWVQPGSEAGATFCFTVPV